MLTELYLQNFQSHKQTKLEFSSGINVITGDSGTGKTAILRALRWLIYNRPLGESYRSHWSIDNGKTSASLVLESCSITRIKSNNINEYSLSTELDEFDYKALGRDVPKDIKEALNISDINFQYQFDAPFLLSMSPGEASKYLNQIVDLDVIDRATSNIKKQLSTNKNYLSGREHQLNQHMEELKEYDGVDENEQLAQNTGKIVSELRQIDLNYNTLLSMLDSINVETERLSTLPDTSKIEELYNNTELLHKKYNDTQSEQEELDSLLYEIEALEEGISIVVNKITKLSLQFERAFSTCPLCGQKRKQKQ